MIYMLQVILFLGLICFQTRSVCFNPGQFGAGTKHRSQVTGHCSTNTETTVTIYKC